MGVNKLVIDVGNTQVKYGHFLSGKLVKTKASDRLTLHHLKEIIRDWKSAYVILSSVKHLPKGILSYLEKDPSKFFMMSHHLEFPFKIAYKTPHTLGLDRIAGIAGAWSRFPWQNTLVIDAGTCIKYDLISSGGIYLGGNISPGIHMRLKAMSILTDKLPYVEPYKRFQTMGKDTRTALQIGASTGAIYEIRGFIENYKSSFAKLNIILTGGDAPFFVNKLKTKIFTAPYLVLEGLNEILDNNAQIPA